MNTKEKLLDLPNLIRTIGAISSAKEGTKHFILKQAIFLETSYMPPKTSFDIRIWSIIHDLTDMARCPCGCGIALPHPFKRTYIKGHAAKCADIRKIISDKNSVSMNDPKTKEKRRKTNLERYGSENVLDKTSSVRKQIEESNVLQFGSISPFSNKEVMEKSKQTMLERHGVENPMQIDNIKATMKQNNMKKYGVENTFQIPKVASDIQIRNREAFLKSIFNSNRLGGKFTPMFARDEYKGCNIIHDFKCNTCGNIVSSHIDDGKIPRCFICNPIQFGEEQKEVFEFLRTLTPNLILQNNRTVITPLELDFYCPVEKIAIEFNGVYWHSEKFKDSKYHLNKTELCKAAGIRLIHIFEHEWNVKKDIIKSKLKSIFQKARYTIHARKCEVKEIDFKKGNAFLDKYHLQGADRHSIAYGLFHRNHLVAVMTFCKPRFDKQHDWELLRYATINGFAVIGGAGKLLAEFRRNHSNQSIVTYADRRWSHGDMYLKLGFQHLHNSAPNYFYVKENKILSRYQCQKHMLEKFLTSFDPQMTETQNMENNGWHKIWDCGNMVFVLK